MGKFKKYKVEVKHKNGTIFVHDFCDEVARQKFIKFLKMSAHKTQVRYRKFEE